jgi:hypothetical protein
MSNLKLKKPRAAKKTGPTASNTNKIRFILPLVGNARIVEGDLLDQQAVLGLFVSYGIDRFYIPRSFLVSVTADIRAKTFTFDE